MSSLVTPFPPKDFQLVEGSPLPPLVWVRQPVCRVIPVGESHPFRDAVVSRNDLMFSMYLVVWVPFVTVPTLSVPKWFLLGPFRMLPLSKSTQTCLANLPVFVSPSSPLSLFSSFCF